MEAVIFDMDGVLFDTERLSISCWLETAQRMGLGDIRKGAYSCIGLNRTDSRIFIRSLYGDAFPYDEFRAENSALFQEKIERDGLPVKKGAGELLAWLKEKGVKTAVASSTNTQTVKSHMERAGFLPYFQEIIGGDMVEHSKPRPDIYLMACRRLGVEPQKAAAIEDSPNGIRSAHAAGMLPVMVPDMVEPTAEIEALLYRKCRDLVEVKNLFEQIFLSSNINKERNTAVRRRESSGLQTAWRQD